ncbi:glycogen [starch] synthase-like [Copidosoma floridanum]|uniref:glycogen [starch] synthase-like n=1 Tax=Copidosoma floridanum TaxID=29053 RepID=UPI000C6F9E0D|nr:glycogen [starch] synthase-like [Copidosoma floridanum]
MSKSLNRRFYRLNSNQELLNEEDTGVDYQNESRWCFEVAWEAANKVGGIYTVIRSKAYSSTEEMGDHYCLIGPYSEVCAKTEVEEADFHEKSPLFDSVRLLQDQGFKLLE